MHIKPNIFQSLQHSRHRQHGVALAVALILLVVVTIIGLAGIRGTGLQERMSGNMYDRSLAFQRAEAGLRAAEDAITANWEIADLGGIDCSPGAPLCRIVPSTTFTADNTNWINVNAAHDVNNGLTPGTPQYHIQLMGTGSSESEMGLEANADYGNYGNPYPPDDVAYYRITTRSSNPGDANNRAIVVLQSTLKRAY